MLKNIEIEKYNLQRINIVLNISVWKFQQILTNLKLIQRTVEISRSYQSNFFWNENLEFCWLNEKLNKVYNIESFYISIYFDCINIVVWLINYVFKYAIHTYIDNGTWMKCSTISNITISYRELGNDQLF